MSLLQRFSSTTDALVEKIPYYTAAMSALMDAMMCGTSILMSVMDKNRVQLNPLLDGAVASEEELGGVVEGLTGSGYNKHRWHA